MLDYFIGVPGVTREIFLMRVEITVRVTNALELER